MAPSRTQTAIIVADKHGLEGDVRSAFLIYWSYKGDRENLMKRLGRRKEVLATFLEQEERMIELFCDAAMIDAERIGIPKRLKGWLDKQPYTGWTEEERHWALDAFQALCMIENDKARYVASDLARIFRKMIAEDDKA